MFLVSLNAAEVFPEVILNVCENLLTSVRIIDQLMFEVSPMMTYIHPPVDVIRSNT